MANLTISCPAPFLAESDYPSPGGYINGRFCGPVTADLSCCLPCPLAQWVYSDAFTYKANVAYWFNVPALVAQVFLMVTFVVLGRGKGNEGNGGHYLSWGLCGGLVMLELSFILPLGTKPDQCFNNITPRDMYSSLSCAWSGALLEAGAMCTVVWILLRSLWTHLRVCWDIQYTPIFMWLAHAFGWGLPLLFLAISLPVTGVSYRLGATCIPNPHGAFTTWFGWLIAFGCLAAMIQFVTTGFCLVVYARSLLRHHSSAGSTGSASSSTPVAGTKKVEESSPSNSLGKKLAWRRVHKVMQLQWRSILLSIMVITQSIYFGTVYVAQQRAAEEDAKPEHTKEIEAWSLCLITSGGEKEKCLGMAKALGIPETTVVGSLFMASVIGIFTFCLMIRLSMLVGWWELIRNPRRRTKPQSNLDFLVASRGGSKRISLGAELRSPEKTAGKDMEMPQGVLPTSEDSLRQMSVPEAGDVTKRHETTNWFEESDGGEEENEEETRRRRFGDNDVV